YLNTFREWRFKNVISLCTKYKSIDFAPLLDLVVQNVDSHGKLLWFEFYDSNFILVCHFGLHGFFSHKKDGNSKMEFELFDDSKIIKLYFSMKLGGGINVIT